jgi:hypothetical protein
MHFLGIGDFGGDECDGTVEGSIKEGLSTLATSMANHITAKWGGDCDFVAGLGDNFYPAGISSCPADESEMATSRFKTNWADVFLVHPALQRPWLMVLGNHDHGNLCHSSSSSSSSSIGHFVSGNPRAQIEFTRSRANPGGLWVMEDTYYKKVFPSSREEPGSREVHLFFLDTTGAQFRDWGEEHNPRVDMGNSIAVQEQLERDIQRLKEDLARCPKDAVKIVFGHHGMFCQGANHGIIGDCLRERSFTPRRWTNAIPDRPPREGFGLEDVLVEGGVRLYLSGHEHVLQHHTRRGILHVGAGASLPHPHFYGQPSKTFEMDWWDKDMRSGFAAVEVDPSWTRPAASRCSSLTARAT